MANVDISCTKLRCGRGVGVPSRKRHRYGKKTIQILGILLVTKKPRANNVKNKTCKPSFVCRDLKTASYDIYKIYRKKSKKALRCVNGIVRTFEDMEIKVSADK
ncbi:hypothetical protein AVEN_77161-1 [Araneus ventricosus]|uniref:Uncharacterized protein n=1 Tax=Araneus ventricosus TaxID=182803 RepID=A0A4Y2IDJ4_ARAVE|nr:hypothetical protein AVEN_77161-1 [Araneus ventricosus]